MSSHLKTLSLIETEKLRNFQASLKTLYDISEKYDKLSEEFDATKEKICPSCKNVSQKEQKSAIGGGKQEDVSLITPQNAEDVSNVGEMITEQNSKLEPNPSNESQWYQIL